MFATNRRRFLVTLGLGTASLGTLAFQQWTSPHSTADRSQWTTLSRKGRALGTIVSLTVLHTDPAHAERALSAGFAALELVESVMSLYRPASELSRLNRDGFLRNPSPMLVEILKSAQLLSETTNGAFDVTVQPLWQLYATCERQKRIPTPEEVTNARRLVDWRQLVSSPREIRLKKQGMAITLNGIAQGFAAEHVCQTLAAHGIQHALVDTGEVGASGHQQPHVPWEAGIQHPQVEDAYITLVSLDHRYLATSGNYATRFPVAQGHHLFDPRTGRSPGEVASVSVLARKGWEADALSTAACILGPDEGSRLIAATPEADAYFVLADGRTWATPGFPQKELAG